MVLLNLRAIPLNKHRLSSNEIVTSHLMHLDKGAYEPTLLIEDILPYYQKIINQLKEIDKPLVVTDLFYSTLLGDEVFKDHDLQ